MKRITLITLFFLLTNLPSAQAQLQQTDQLKNSLQTQNKDTVAWVHGGLINIGMNEGFLHNWAAGGEIASLTINGIFSGFVTRMAHNKVWTNNLDLAYGLFYAYSNHFVPKKTDDRIDFTSKIGVRADTNGCLFLTGLFNFKSQFTKGFDYSVPSWDTMPTSKLLSPAYFTLAAGLEYRKGTDLNIFLSPFAGRLVVSESQYTRLKADGAFGIDYNKTSKMQFGAYFSGRYQRQVTKNFFYKTRLDLYANYFAKNLKDADGNIIKKDNPGNIDILFDNLVSYKLSRFIDFTVGATFIYDNDIPYANSYKDASGNVVNKSEPGNGLGWWQIKQIMTLGFEYRF